ncbi:MAG: hypothetical protein KGR21_09670 [Proteobacteria bacterium]|nr:hypothetical protein [Pseudomonadota bacterium]
MTQTLLVTLGAVLGGVVVGGVAGAVVCVGFDCVAGSADDSDVVVDYEVGGWVSVGLGAAVEVESWADESVDGDVLVSELL